jgi:glycosyltransferase involved in cell wall biosynthesis
MNFGCPSCAFAVGGIPEVTVSGETGLLAPFGDTTALADGIETLLRDPVRRTALGRAAQQRAREKFSAAAIVPRYEALYRRVGGI